MGADVRRIIKGDTIVHFQPIAFIYVDNIGVYFVLDLFNDCKRDFGEHLNIIDNLLNDLYLTCSIGRVFST